MSKLLAIKKVIIVGCVIAVIILLGIIAAATWPTWSVWVCLAPGSCGAGIPPITR